MGEYRALSLKDINLHIRSEEGRIDEDFLGHCKRHAEYLIPQLADLAHTTNLVVRYRAVWLLANLDWREGINRLLSFIHDASDYLKNAPLEESVHFDRISFIRDRAISTIRDLPIQLSYEIEQAILQVLLPRLYEYNDQHRFYGLLRTLTMIDSTQLRDELEYFMKQAKGVQLAGFTSAMLELKKDDNIVETARKLLLEEDRPYSIVGMEILDDAWDLLFGYSDAKPAKFDLAIAEALVNFIRRNLKTIDPAIDQYIARCLHIIPLPVLRENADLLEEILESRLNKWTKTTAIERQAEINPVQVKTTVFDVLQHNSRDLDAVRMLYRVAKILRKSKDPEAVKAIVEMKSWLKNILNENPYLLTQRHGRDLPYMNAMLELNGLNRDLIDRYRNWLDPEELMRIHCLEKQITAQEVVTRLEESGLIVVPDADHFRNFREQWDKGDEQYPALCNLLKAHRRYFSRAMECNTILVDYSRLLASFESIAEPFFVIPDFSQNWRGDEPRQFSFEIGFKNHMMTFVIPSNGTGYDPEPFVTALNELLARTGRGERFFNLFTGGQDAAFVFAPAATFISFANWIRLPVLADMKNKSKETDPPVWYPLLTDGFSGEYLRLER